MCTCDYFVILTFGVRDVVVAATVFLLFLLIFSESVGQFVYIDQMKTTRDVDTERYKAPHTYACAHCHLCYTHYTDYY